VVAQLELTPEEVHKLVEQLHTFHQQFHHFFRREEQRVISLAYMKGLASALEAKSAEPICTTWMKKALRNMQHFLTAAIWDEENLQVKRYGGPPRQAGVPAAAADDGGGRLSSTTSWFWTRCR
jgi:hypothetical protein